MLNSYPASIGLGKQAKPSSTELLQDLNSLLPEMPLHQSLPIQFSLQFSKHLHKAHFVHIIVPPHNEQLLLLL